MIIRNYIPKIAPLFGELRPGLEEIAEAIAKKEQVKIKPAVHKLGLKTQVPNKEDEKKLMNDIKLAPVRISDYINSLLKEDK